MVTPPLKLDPNGSRFWQQLRRCAAATGIMLLSPFISGCEHSPENSHQVAEGPSSDSNSALPSSALPASALPASTVAPAVSNSPSTLQRFTQELQGALDATSKTVSNISPSTDDLKSLTTDEVNKLFSFEYRVVTLEKKLNTEELETALAALGVERWECFDIDAYEDKYRVFCRRRPQTYLRFIPRFFP